MLSRLFGKRDPPEQVFWRWFSEKADAYRTFELGGPEQDGLLAQLDRALDRVQRGLKYDIGVDPGGAERELVISADGIRDRFPVVQSLVEAAPELPGWKITAFRQRKDLDQVRLEVAGETVDADRLWFALRPEGDRIGITLAPAGFADPTSEPAMLVCFLMLDIALGEYDVETKVGTIETQPLSVDPEAQGLKPFKLLPEEFDALYRLMNEG